MSILAERMTFEVAWWFKSGS